MKKKFIKFSAVSLTAAVMATNMSCKDKDDAPTLSIDPSVTEIVFTAETLPASASTPTAFTVTTNQGEWKVEKNATWVNVPKNSAGTGFSVSVSANETIQEREDEITVSAGSAQPVKFKVKQSADNARLTVTPSVTGDVVFKADGTPDTETTPTTFQVSTNVGSWKVEKDQDWLIVDEGENSFTLSVTPHESLDAPEAAKVTVSAGSAASVVINVKQKAAEPFLRLSPSGLTVVINAAGTAATTGSLTYEVETNNPTWEVVKNQSWLTVTYSENKITLSTDNNEDFVDIMPLALVDVKAGSATITLQVTQENNPNGVPKAAASTQQWPKGNLVWSDYIEYGDDKEDFDGNNTDGDYRNAGTYKGYLYSWYFVDLHPTELCPAPWQVPSKDDFVDLDIALGGTGENDQTGKMKLLDDYINEWGAVYSGYSNVSGTLTYQGSYIYCWSSTEATTTTAYYQLITNVGASQPYGSTSSTGKVGGRPVRCVKKVE